MGTFKTCNAITAIIQHEMLNLMRKKILLLLVFVYPVLTLVFFIYLFSSGTITQMPVAVVDEDSSEYSRFVIDKISAAPAISISKRFTEMSPAKNALLNGEIFAIILIPYNFEKNALGGHQPAIVTYINGQYMSVAKVLSEAVNSTILNLSKKSSATNMTDKTGLAPVLAQMQVTAIPVSSHPLFNPTLNYHYSLGNGLFPTVLQIIMMLIAGSSILNDLLDPKNRENALHLSNGNSFLWISSKLLPYFILYLAYLTLFDFILVYYQGMPINGHLAILFLGNVLFIISALLFGTLIALVSKSRTKMISFVSIFSSPAFGFSGLMFPRIAMNLFSYYWGAILPTTWYLDIRLEQTLRNNGDVFSFNSIVGLIILSSVLALLIIPFARLKKLEKNDV